jgi:phospholipid/cholesterol/gamma-HCH transport system ATP-binding protein
MEVIGVRHLKKSFAGKHVHKDVSFSVEKGECLGLLGGSGSGKSVILRSIIGLERPDSGQVCIDGVDISKLSESELFSVRKKVAYAFQNGALFDSMSVFENVAYGLAEHSDLSPAEIADRVFSLLKDFNLHGTEKLFPAELSGGMQKRVGLARAIALSPKAILYDEPTAGLDPANTIKIQELISRLQKRGTTAILVTHDMETALAVCDRICFLNNGEIENLGSIEEIKKNKDGLLKLFIRGQDE